MLEYKTKLHTIFLTVGPSGCGKSFFSEKYLVPLLKNNFKEYVPNIQYISSDALRREVLGKDLHKYDQKMVHANEQAFNLLHQKLECVTSYPINAEFVIVDSTGLSDYFRKQVVETARKNHYSVEVVLFDYTKREEYFKYCEDTPLARKIMNKHLKIFREEVYSKLSRRDFKAIHKIKSKDFAQVKFTVENVEEYLSHFLSDEFDYLMIGDVHGCLDELKELLQKNKFEIENGKIVGNSNTKIILIGDWIDKGTQVTETNEFITANLDRFILVKGNHENYVYKHINGVLPKNHQVDQELLDTFFTSVAEFKDKPEVIKQFNKLVKMSKEFYVHPKFIVTHAPAKNKYLGKIDNISLKKQRVLRSPQKSDNYLAERDEFFSFLKEDSAKYLPYHVFGHEAFKQVLLKNNKIGLDTGCSMGGNLSAVQIGDKPFISKVHYKGDLPKEELFDLFSKPKEVKKVNWDDLLDREKSRLKYVARNKINFISGTMCPADKKGNDLESLEEGLNYFKRNNIKKVILQPKYMGSYCNVYLHRDLDKCYAVTRNGYKINQDLTPVYEELLYRLDPWMSFEKIDSVILAGELMPWATLGTTLIDQKFKVIDKALETENEILKELNFDEKYEKLISQFEESEYLADCTLSKKELRKKYPDPLYSTYKSLKYNRTFIPMEDKEVAQARYHRQMELYGGEGEIHYKPFAILKTIHFDGSERLYFDESNEWMFKTLNDDLYAVIDLESDYAEALEYFNIICLEKNMEGIVIKPLDKAYVSGVAPFMKVRNPEYLSIIYGHDYLFEHKYTKLIDQKRIRGKLRASISDYELGKKMLETKMSDVSKNNKDYLDLIAAKILEERKEEKFDPRL